MSSAAQSPVLTQQLERARGFAPEYRGGLSNHLPMALRALAAIGGSDEQLRGFSVAYEPRLDPLPRAEDAASAARPWLELVGQADAFMPLLAGFERDLQKLGRGPVLQRALPALLPGIGAHAFHGLIRSAYALRFEDDAELAHGLAYWASGARPLAALEPGGEREREPVALLQRVRSSALGAPPSGGYLISDRMHEIAARPGFGEAVGALSVRDDTLERIARAMARVFAASGDFTALHGLTATHAFRVIEPLFAERELARRYLWQALLAAYVTAGAPDPELQGGKAAPSWDALLELARGRLDDHDVKLIDSAHEEDLHYGEPMERVAAARRLGLL